MVQRKKRLLSNCPICNLPDEDTIHVLRCQAVQTLSLRHNLLTELQCWMIGKDTHPDIVTFIVNGLESWFNNSPHHIDRHSLEHSMYLAFKTQVLLGWDSLLFGLVTSPIIICQQQYFSSIRSRRLGTRWGIQLVGKMWNIIYQIWTHRNNCLHETQALTQNCGKDQLKLAIIHEHVLGIGDLPSVYRPYFTSLPSLLEKSTKHQKQWFLVIRSGRESCLSFQHYDNFSTEPSLRSWIGLSSLS